MRGDHHGALEALQCLLQPLAGERIQVVGRLIQQQHIRTLHQPLGQRDAHLPAAGEFQRRLLLILWAEPEPGEYRMDLCFHPVAAERLEPLQQMSLALHQRVQPGTTIRPGRQPHLHRCQFFRVRLPWTPASCGR